MQYQKYADRFQYLKDKIKEEKTGSPDDLARRWGISKRMVFYYLDLVKSELEQEIEYCHQAKTYKFKNSR